MSTKKPDRPQPNVYLIDDDQVITFLLVDLVESVGLPYAVFNDAPSFLKQDLSSLAGCIVTDVRMPGSSGLDLLTTAQLSGTSVAMIEKHYGHLQSQRAADALAALIDAFHHIQRLRLEHQVNSSVAMDSNRVNPDELHELDRLILKESLKQVQHLQKRLTRQYLPA